VIGIRLALVALVCLTTVPSVARADGDGPARRARLLDPARVRQLADTLRSDPDEKRRKAAVKELADADPRMHAEVIPALIAALRKDSASVRASAAEAIGRFRTVYPLAGAALEIAAESDPSQAVRDAAKQSLWEYHLNGYKSTKDTFFSQTAEPPIAKPATPQPPITTEPTPAPAIVVANLVPTPEPPSTLPLSVSAPGPRVALLDGTSGPRSVLGPPPVPNLTGEPPLANPASRTPTPKLTSEPPILLSRWPEPVIIGQSPAFTLELPPIVTPP
jgi:hypothetical protein